MNRVIDVIKELRKTPRGKAILFFGFYFIFFIAIMLFSRLGNHSYTGTDEYEVGTKYSLKVSKIESNNYNYTYKVNLDGVDYIYTGSRYENYQNISFNNNTYFRTGDEYFINNSIWVKCDNPIMFYKFLDSKIKDIASISTYESSTDYDSGKKTYNFLISSNTLNRVFDDIDSDFDEVPNSLVISTDEEGYVNSVNYNLDSYCKVNNLCTNSLRISIDYDNFGEVEEIKSIEE